MKHLVVWVVLALSLTACSRGGSGSGGKTYKKLDAAEKSRLKDLNQSMGDAVSFATSYVDEGLSKVGSGIQLSSRKVVALMVGDSPRTINDGSKITPSAQKMKDKLNKDDCEMKLPEDIEYLGGNTQGTGSDQKIPVFEMSITGEDCPIFLKMSVQGSYVDPSKERFIASFSYTYQAFSDEFKELTDVDKMDMTGRIDGSVSAPKNGQQGATSITMNLSFTGKGHSQKEGDFTNSVGANTSFRINMPDSGFGKIGSIGLGQVKNIDNGDFNFGVDIQGYFNESLSVAFASLDTIVEKKSNWKGFFDVSDKYYVNKEEVSAAEYAEYSKGLSYPGMKEGSAPSPIDNIGGGNGPTSGVVQCWLSTYDAQFISLPDVESAIAQGREPRESAFWSADSCGLDNQFMNYNQMNLHVMFYHQPDQVMASYFDGINEPQTFFGLEGENLDQARQSGSVILRWTCSAKNTCL